jgi:hypothetical protein
MPGIFVLITPELSVRYSVELDYENKLIELISRGSVVTFVRCNVEVLKFIYISQNQQRIVNPNVDRNDILNITRYMEQEIMMIKALDKKVTSYPVDMRNALLKIRMTFDEYERIDNPTVIGKAVLALQKTHGLNDIMSIIGPLLVKGRY